jgi:hypothetical protein
LRHRLQQIESAGIYAVIVGQKDAHCLSDMREARGHRNRAATVPNCAIFATASAFVENSDVNAC